MSVAIRFLPLTVLLALAAFVGWRVLKVGVAEQVVAEQPQKALEWNSGNPAALLALAQAQLDRKEPKLAAEVARSLRFCVTNRASVIEQRAQLRYRNR